MKNLCKVSLAVAIATAAFSPQAQAQTVELKGLGSSAMFLQLGLAASSNSAIGATCVWSENTNLVWASDTQAAALDKGSAWVAWTKGTGGSCTSPASDAKIYAYLQTDSVVGNRCLFDGTCTINFDTTAAGSSPAGLILGTASEVALPSTVATAMGVTPNGTAPNFAGTDIRPEDAAFATLRAINPTGNTLPCGTAINSTQYLGLGYASGTTIKGSTPGLGSSFNVVNFTLPSSFTVKSLGAVPILVVAASSDTTGAGITQFSSITSTNLAKLLDGTYSSANQIGGTGSDAIYVFEREPLSGTYNTMEYNVPNTTVNKTSQDVGQNQLTAQQACNTDGTPINPLSIVTNSTTNSARYRAIGTGNELKAARTYNDAHNLTNNLGYGFWSVANYSGYAGTLTNNAGNTVTAKYLNVDGVDPLGASGTIPTTTAQINAVTLPTIINGTYPIWSMLRLVTVGNSSTSAATAATALQGAVQQYVGTGNYPTKRPDFVPYASMTVVRSHFAPPSVTFPVSNTPNNGGSCGTEAGGDVGGVVLHTGTSTTCTTGERR